MCKQAIDILMNYSAARQNLTLNIIFNATFSRGIVMTKEWLICVVRGYTQKRAFTKDAHFYRAIIVTLMCHIYTLIIIFIYSIVRRLIRRRALTRQRHHLVQIPRDKNGFQMPHLNVVLSDQIPISRDVKKRNKALTSRGNPLIKFPWTKNDAQCPTLKS